MNSPFCNAVLLAAGRSSRMGQDKALLKVAGTPLWQRQCEILVSAGAREIYVSAREEQSWPPAVFARVRDAVTDTGPISGIQAALERCQFPHLIVLAIDLAHMTPEWFHRLLAQCDVGIGAVGRWPSGQFEPLAAVYPKELLGELRAACALREYSLQKIIGRAVTDKRMKTVELSETEHPLFANWNVPSDLTAV